MIRATVIGPLWATKRIDMFPAGALLEVQEVGSDRRLVALDQLGAGPGELVLVALGSAVSHHLAGNAPIDALVVGVIDELPSTPAEPNLRKNSHERKEQ